MSEPDAGDGGGGGSGPTGDDRSRALRLRSLGERIKRRRAERAPPPEPGATEGGRGQGLAMRLAAEFVAGILVGGAIGWFFDRWLGTSPWGLIVFVLLGFTAGVLNALRSAGLVAEAPGRRDRAGED